MAPLLQLIVFILHAVLTSFADATTACSICGKQSRVGNPKAWIYRGGEPTSMQCKEMEELGFQGKFSQQECTLLIALVHDICECTTIDT